MIKNKVIEDRQEIIEILDKIVTILGELCDCYEE